MPRRFVIFLFSLLVPALLLMPGHAQSTPPSPAPPPALATPAEASPTPPNSPPSLPAASLANPDAAFSRALTAYNAGALEEARKEFLAIVEAGHLSAPLTHNLGNIEFRLGNDGQAVLWYKRALVMNPISPETLQNLRAVARKTAFLSFDRFGISVAHLKLRWLQPATILAAWLAILLVVWLVWMTPRQGRRWPLVTLLTLVLPLWVIGLGLMAALKKDDSPLAKRQIVSGKETNAYAAPAEASTSVIALPAGSEVVPVESRGNWHYCIIPSGSEGQPLRGWIRSAKLEPLWPWPAGI